MRALRPSLSLAVGLAASVVIHAALLVPLLVHVMTARPERPPMQVAIEQRHLREPAEPPDDRVDLGVEHSAAATMTWVGYEEYQEHLARLSEVEQAAFTVSPGSASEALPAPAETAEPVVEPAPGGAPEAVPDAAPIPPGGAAEAPATGDPVAAAVPPDLWTQVLSRLAAAVRQARRIAERAPEPEPAPGAERPDTARPSASPGEPGDPSDRESDPTSVTDVLLEDLKAGRPLAARGLEITTRRPEFSTLVLLTASPRNPLAELRFGRDGKPRRALLIEPSGHGGVDEAIVSSLYRWRATGEALEALEGEHTVNVRIRLLLGVR